MKKRILSLLLILCFVLSAIVLSSCGKDTVEETTAISTTAATAEATTAGSEATGTQAPEETTAQETTALATTDKWEDIASKINAIAARDRNIKIEASINVFTSLKTSKNDIYMKGPDTIDGNTPQIQQMVYERNRAAAEKLGVDPEFVFWDYGWGAQADPINTVVQGKAADAPDLFVNMLYDLHVDLLKGDFKDIWSIPNGYFDFSASGWLKDWMENLSFTNDRAYILGSDYFLDIFRSTSVIPFNMTMMDSNADLLAPFILPDGETLQAGEKLTAYFFDLVDDGKWTWDVLGHLCESIWVDTDGDGQDSILDRLGIVADTYGGEAAATFVYSCGEQFVEAYIIEDETSKYNGKQWIRYVDSSEGLGQVFDAVSSVFAGPGAMATSGARGSNSADNPGVTYHHNKFKERGLLFAGVCLLGGLEDEVFQTMEDLYSVVPCPKLGENYEYNTSIFNCGDAAAMNVNSNSRKARVLSAYIQYCTENSGDIREEFQQIVMKYRVTTYNQGTDRMLDIIYNGILWGRDKMVEDRNIDPHWHKLIKTNGFTAGADYAKQQVEAAISSKQHALDEVMKTWYTLPKVEPTAE